jgi:hypothetical protein
MKKKILILIVSVSIGLSAKAQIYTPSGIIQGSTPSNYVGVGTSNPSNLLTIQGFHSDSRLLLHSVGGGYESREADLMLWSSEPGTTYDGVGIANNMINSYNYANGGSAINRISTTRGGSYIRLLNNSMLFHLVSNSGEDKELINLNSNGNVGIGTVNPAYKLDVLGTIRSREVKVDLLGADFVFDNDYKLMPLGELEKFINERKHLPEIASAKEMEINGVELGELNSKLLQKTEELTLYIIQQQKEIDELKSMLTSLKESIKKDSKTD